MLQEKTVTVDLSRSPSYVHPMQSVAMAGNTLAVCKIGGEHKVIDVSMIPDATLRFDGELLLFLYMGVEMPIGMVL